MPTQSATLRPEQAQSSSNVSTQPGETQRVETQQAFKPSHQPNKHSMPQKKQPTTTQPPTASTCHKAEQDGQQPPVSWVDKYLHDILSQTTL